jgi:exo-beta-1,3-glucanase (GH17 family)
MRLWVACLSTVTAILILAAATRSYAANTTGNLQTWQERIVNLAWVAYSPPSANPQQGVEATADDIRQDVSILQGAKFTGLVTYGSSGLMGTEFPRIAQEVGFKGLIMGIWDPSNQQEIAAAVAAAGNPIVLGYCVGNEGLPEKEQPKGRYTLEQLTAVIQSLQTLTGKPVTTAEQYGDYSDERLLKLGDWVFPTVHPYFYHVREPLAAVKWTKAAYDDLKKRSGRLVLFKEVGLPTAGDEEGRMSEAAQEKYYTELAKTDVKFVYFEGFDQPWKTHLPIEPHWGIFKADRTPKLFAAKLLGETTTAKENGYFYVYEDADSKRNHFTPSGYMGDYNDIQMDDQFKQNPHSGNSCILVVYSAKGKGPGKRPVKWAGVYWQQPEKNWGKDPKWQGRGYDLSAYARLTFWARAERECEIEFKVGGIDGPYGDSLKQAREVRAKLGPKWQRYEIGLKGANLKHIIGGFCWVTNWEDNPDGVTFYLDDIRFEKK